MKKKKGTSLLGFGLFILAAALVVVAYVIYQSTQAAAASLQSSVAQTGNVNTLAGQFSSILTSLGVKSGN